MGLASSSHEKDVTNKKGHVMKVRAICRVVEASRWSLDAIDGVVGTPSKMCAVGAENISTGIEESSLPHADLDSEQREAS